MKYVRYDAPSELRLRYHFRNRFGRDIIGARDYDPITGKGHKLNPNNPEKLDEFFEPNGFVDLDGHVNPSEELLNEMFIKHPMLQDKESNDLFIRKTEERLRLEKGIRENQS